MMHVLPHRHGRMLLAATALLLCLAAGAVPWLQHLDTRLYDHVTAPGPSSPAQSVLLVAIDPPSLRALGPWPWPGTVHARLLDRLTDVGAGRVALDLPLWRADTLVGSEDTALATAIGRNGQVVLRVDAAPSRTVGAVAGERQPLPMFAARAAALGHGTITADGDGIVRRAWLYAGADAPHWPALALALVAPAAAQGGADTAATRSGPWHWQQADAIGLRYPDPAGRVPQVSYVAVLDGRIGAAQLRGRQIIVGPTAAPLAQPVMIPRTGQPVSATEYHALVASLLLAQQHVVWMTPLPAQAVGVLLAMLAALALAAGGHWRWLGAGTALLGPPLLAWALLRYADLWWPPSVCWATGTAITLACAGGAAAAWYRDRANPLAGLGRPGHLHTELQRAQQAARQSAEPLALVLIEVHAVPGSRTRAASPVRHLRAFAALLRQHARRPRDTLAQLAPTRMALLLPGTPAEGAEQVVHDLLCAVRHGPLRDQVQLSVGIGCQTPPAHATAGALLQAATAALQQAHGNPAAAYVLHRVAGPDAD